MNTKALFTAAIAVSVALLVSGCEEKKDGAATAGSADKKKDGDDKKTDDKKADDKKAEDNKGGGDIEATCNKLCDKTVACAEDVAKSTGAPEEVVKKAKEEAEKNNPECKKSCGQDAKTASDKDKAEMGKVEECVAKECADFVKCMDAI